MNFKIGKDYKIHLTETGMTEADVEPDDPMITESFFLSKHLIEVGSDGNIIVKEIE